MIEPDVINDILRRAKAKAGLDDATAKDIEREARQYWGGERCYVAKAGETPRRREAMERAESIRADHRRGERIPLLARRYDLSERRIRQILGIIEATAEPAANDETQRRQLPTRKSRHRRKNTSDPETTLP